MGRKYIILFSFFVLQIICAQSKSPEQIAITALIDKASVQYQQGKYMLSLQNSREALLKSLSIGDERLIAYSYNSVGVVYNEFSNSKHAIEFYQKALLYADKTDDLNLKNWVLGNLGSVYYYDLKDYKKGISFYKKSLEIAKNTKNDGQVCYTKLNIAGAYLAIFENEQAKTYLSEVKPLLKVINQKDAEIQYLNNLGVYFLQTNKLDSAEKNFKDAYEIALVENSTFHLIDICKNLDELYEKTGNVDQKNLFLKRLQSYQKIIDNEKQQSKLDDNAIQIELDINKIKLEKVELLYEKQMLAIRDNQIIYGLFTVIILGLAIFVFVLYQNFKKSKAANKLLETTNQQLVLMRNKAEENANLKAQFVATISHELRTPLYGVIGIVDLFSEPNAVNENYKGHLKSLKFSARYLLGLVNNILQVSKIDNGHITLDSKMFDIREELQVIKNSLHYLEETNLNNFLIEVADHVPQLIIGDATRLSQIIMNLCSNALKFTSNGKVVLTVNLVSRAAGKVRLAFKISDNGIGIPIEYQSIIFDKFVQVQRNNASYQGTGLGLTIVKNLIDLFESKITVDSTPNQGTTFFFEIEFVEKKQFKKQIKKDNLANVNKKFKILVVEDNAISNMLTCKVIDNEGHLATGVDNGFDAIKKLEESSFDLIFLDLNMPQIDGFETAINIRKINLNIPIIALTAQDATAVQQKALDSGLTDIVEKPFEKSQLVQIIQKYIIS